MKFSGIALLSIFVLTLSAAGKTEAAQTFAEKNSGKIFLQVQEKGEAWYVNPADLKRYYLGKPQDAYEIMRKLGIGITDEDLAKIPVGVNSSIGEKDTDEDGLSDDTESAIGTDPNKADSDEDGYSDGLEVDNNYNPLGNGASKINKNFARENSGKIFLQVEKKGEAWYVNPGNLKRYYLGKPRDAFGIMRSLGIGITDEGLAKITEGKIETNATTIVNNTTQNNYSSNPNTAPDTGVMKTAASAIYNNDQNKISLTFTSGAMSLASYTAGYLDQDGRTALSYILQSAELTSLNETEKIYKSTVYFPLGGYNTEVLFHVLKQEDGTWKLANL